HYRVEVRVLLEDWLYAAPPGGRLVRMKIIKEQKADEVPGIGRIIGSESDNFLQHWPDAVDLPIDIPTRISWIFAENRDCGNSVCSRNDPQRIIDRVNRESRLELLRTSLELAGIKC